MFNHSVRRWMPENFSKQELVQQFADAVDWLLSVDYPYADKLAYRFEAIKNKYANLQDVPLEDIYAILEETGYKYITDTLSLQEDELRTFLSFLTFIHMYKGSRRGLEFALRLLNIEYILTEWFEADPLEEPHTFRIDLLSFNPNSVAGLDVIQRIIRFAKQYVYPLMNYLKVEFRLDNTIFNTAMVHQATSDYTFFPDSIYIIWDVYRWDDKLWYYGVNDLIFDVESWDLSTWGIADN